MTGPKTNEREGTRAVLKFARVSPSKVRVVLDLIRGRTVDEAREILRFTERDTAILIGKLVESAVANATHNDSQDPDELFVSACYADEGPTLKRFRPRARGRVGHIAKRTAHVTLIVSRLPEDRLARLRAQRAAEVGSRARRVAAGRAGRVRRSRQQEAAVEAVAEEGSEVLVDQAPDLDVPVDPQAIVAEEEIQAAADEAVDAIAAEPAVVADVAPAEADAVVEAEATEAADEASPPEEGAEKPEQES